MASQILNTLKKEELEVRPNQISLETAQMISKKLNMPLEHVMHTPPHILMEKLKRAELSETEQQESTDPEE